MIQKSTSLKYEPSSEALLISVKKLFLNRELIAGRQMESRSRRPAKTTRSVLHSLFSQVVEETHGFPMPCLTPPNSHGKVGGGTIFRPAPHSIPSYTVFRRTHFSVRNTVPCYTVLCRALYSFFQSVPSFTQFHPTLCAVLHYIPSYAPSCPTQYSVNAPLYTNRFQIPVPSKRISFTLDP